MRLSQDAINRLNGIFYAAAPYEHLEHRLFLILSETDTTGTPPDTQTFRQFQDVFLRTAGAESAETADAARSAEEPDDDLSVTPDEHRIIDSIVLAFQAGETLLRMHLAHLAVRDGLAQSGWLAVSNRNQGQFRNNVVTLASKTDSELREDIKWLHIAPEVLSPENTIENLDARIDGVLDTGAAWIKHFARQYLDLGPLYNAAKHGLAVIPGYHSIEFYPESPSAHDPSLPLLRGATVQYLEQPPNEEDPRRQWVRTMQVADMPLLLATAHIATDYLRNLWGVARVRYAGSQRANLFLLTGPTPQSLRAGSMEGRIRFPINYVPISGDAAVQFLAARGHQVLSPAPTDAQEDS